MAREVWITGIGLVSSLGEGLDAHWRALAEADEPKPNVDLAFTPPFGIHPMVPLDLDTQIPKKSDQRQMEPWQRLGTYAAGLALTDAGIAGNLDILSHTHAVVAADGGERDVPTDTAILDGLKTAATPSSFLNEHLSNDLRPTLFLAQLPNLVAGNISIVHKVTGSSRTFMGEEIAGASAMEVAWRRIGAGQGDIFLVGGACLAERKDSVLNCALGGALWAGEHLPIWERIEKGGGAMLGSVGAFLVLEAREHAEARRPQALRETDRRADRSEPTPPRRRGREAHPPVRRDRAAGQPAGRGSLGRDRGGAGDPRRARSPWRIDQIRAGSIRCGPQEACSARQRARRFRRPPGSPHWRSRGADSTGRSTPPASKRRSCLRPRASWSRRQGCGGAKDRR